VEEINLYEYGIIFMSDSTINNDRIDIMIDKYFPDKRNENFPEGPDYNTLINDIIKPPNYFEDLCNKYKQKITRTDRFSPLEIKKNNYINWVKDTIYNNLLDKLFAQIKTTDKETREELIKEEDTKLNSKDNQELINKIINNIVNTQFNNKILQCFANKGGYRKKSKRNKKPKRKSKSMKKRN